jgi:hypothetical protein
VISAPDGGLRGDPYARLPSSVCFAINIGAHKRPSRRTSVQALGTTPALMSRVEMMLG